MRKQTLAIALIATLATAGCATDEYGNSRNYTNAEKGAMMGAIGGAVIGAAVNHNNRGKGALIGAVGGGLAGGGGASSCGDVLRCRTWRSGFVSCGTRPVR